MGILNTARITSAVLQRDRFNKTKKEMSYDMSYDNILNEFYEKYYDDLFYSNKFNLISRSMSLTHMQLEKNLADKEFKKVLEFGSGNGQHLKHVIHRYEEYHLVDIRKPKLPAACSTEKIRIHVGQLSSLNFEKNYFDRIVITCVLHHIDSLLPNLVQLKKFLKPGGQVDIFLSCDPGLMVRLMRNFITKRAAIKLGFRYYEEFNSLDHINHFHSIFNTIKMVFKDDKIKSSFRPFFLKSWNMNTHCLVRIVKSEITD